MKTRIETLLNQVEKIAKSAISANGKLSETEKMAKLVMRSEGNKKCLIQLAEKVLCEADKYEKELGEEHLSFENMLDVEDILLDLEALYNVPVDTFKNCKPITMRLLYTFDYKKAKEVRFVSHSKNELVDKLADWRWSMYKKHDDFCEGVFTFDGEKERYSFFQSGMAEHDCFDNGFSTNAQYLRWSRKSFNEYDGGEEQYKAILALM